jgi:hypothetical protein
VRLLDGEAEVDPVASVVDDKDEDPGCSKRRILPVSFVNCNTITPSLFLYH